MLFVHNDHPRGTRCRERAPSTTSRPDICCFAAIHRYPLRYSITSSVRASSVGDTVRSSALAVVRLMTRSNFVGCSTGISLVSSRAKSCRRTQRRDGTGRQVWSIGHQASRFHEFSKPARHRQSRSERQRADKYPVRVHKRVGNDVQRVRSALEQLERRIDVRGLAHLRGCNVEAERPSRGLNVAHLQHSAGTAGIGQDRQPMETRDDLTQQLDPPTG